jgi:hypothetical protein
MENIEEALASDFSSSDSQSEEFTNLSITPPSQDKGARAENIEEPFDSDISSHDPQNVEAYENLKMKERCGNIIENKGSSLENGEQSGNLVEKNLVTR